MCLNIPFVLSLWSVPVANQHWTVIILDIIDGGLWCACSHFIVWLSVRHELAVPKEKKAIYLVLFVSPGGVSASSYSCRKLSICSWGRTVDSTMEDLCRTSIRLETEPSIWLFRWGIFILIILHLFSNFMILYRWRLALAVGEWMINL